jgi:hypothetical protein
MDCLPWNGAVMHAAQATEFSEIDGHLARLLAVAQPVEGAPSHLYFRPGDGQFTNIVGEPYQRLIECRYCGFEPKDQKQLPNSQCPKCHRAQGWERQFVLHRKLRRRRDSRSAQHRRLQMNA